MSKKKYQDLIETIATKHRLNPGLVTAIIETESSFETYAMRYEAHWRWFFDVEEHAKALRITAETERQMQKFSYGLMQVMGAVAREHGYHDSLVKLCKPEDGIEYGCKHFAMYLRRYKTVHAALAAYNGGPGAIKGPYEFANQEYVDKVIKRFV